MIANPGKYDFKPYAIGYQKDSPYAELFNFYIDQMRENGVIESIRSKYQGSPQQCPDLRLVYSNEGRIQHQLAILNHVERIAV